MCAACWLDHSRHPHLLHVGVPPLYMYKSACNTKNGRQENYLKLTEEPDQRGVWWLHARARRQLMDNMRMDPNYVTFTVDEARPLRLTHAEVRAYVRGH